MLDQLLFHEKCNNDVDKIIKRIKTADPAQVKKFEQALIEAYQQIYESPNSGTFYYLKGDISINSALRVFYLENFDCAILYKYNQPNRVTVLAVIKEKRSWD